jgi:hypothetical protein
MTTAELFFGRSMPGGGTVSDAAWQYFVDTEVTPRFPAGFTVADGAGQWRSGTDIQRERSKRLTIVLPGLPSDGEKLDAVRRAYVTAFHQEAVLLFEVRGCGDFGPPTPDILRGSDAGL